METTEATNPLLAIAHPIPFDRVEAGHVEPAVDALLERARQKLTALEQYDGAPSYDASLRALEDLTEDLERCMGVVGHLESVSTTDELRAAYNAVQPKVSAFFSSIPMSAGLYRVLGEFARSDEAKSLDPTRKRFVEKTLASFRREGAELGAESKAQLETLNVELSKVTTKFGQNVLDATNAYELVVEDEGKLRGLPARAIEAARESAKAKGVEGFRFTLQAPSFIPVLTYLDDRSIREQMYRGFNTRAASGQYDNRGLVAEIIELRRKKASLLGFSSFVDLVLDDRMAGNGERAMTFVDGLREKSQPAFERENEELSVYARQLTGDASLQLSPWDIGYYAEKRRAALYDFDEEVLRPYLSLEGVLTGLFEIVHKLYGITVTRVEDMPAWHESVRVYRIKDGDGSELGVFYADLYPRESKRDGAWMNAFITAEHGADGWSEHVGLICANVTPPVGDTPALLSHREVETVFHEFGHLLHHMLSRVSVRSLAGTNVAWDFVELPSQIMENFCWERVALDLFARHHESGESIPGELFERMSRARTYRGANAMMRQLGFASLDLALHAQYARERDGDVVDYARTCMQPFAPAPYMPEYAMVLGFGHLFSHPVGYAGGYYSYKWAEVLDADAYSRFREGGVFSTEVAAQFRQRVLSRGDSAEPMELFEDFMGREPDERALLERTGIGAP